MKLSVFGDLRLSAQVLRITSIRSYSRFRRIRRWRNCLENETSVLKKWVIISPLHSIPSQSHHDHYHRSKDIPSLVIILLNTEGWLYPYGSGDNENIFSFIYISCCYIYEVPELNMEIVQGKSIKIKCITFPRCFWPCLPVLSCIAFTEGLVLTWYGCCHTTKCQWVLLRSNTLCMLWMAATSFIKA